MILRTLVRNIVLLPVSTNRDTDHVCSLDVEVTVLDGQELQRIFFFAAVPDYHSWGAFGGVHKARLL